jgi:hypothetical protein
VFGLRLRIIDQTRNFAQEIVAGPAGLLRPGKPNVGDIQRFREFQVLTFGETRWIRPVPLRAHKAIWKLRRVTVIDAQMPGQLYEFYLDVNTMLPYRVVVRTPTQYGIHEDDYRLGNYHVVGGIQLPHQICPTIGALNPKLKENVQYQINPKFDEAIFDSPPSLERGPKGWRGLTY